MAVDYKLTIEDGELISIEAPDGKPVSIDAASRDYAHFLCWAANQPKEKLPAGYQQLIPNKKYFCDELELVEHCKSNGISLDITDRPLHFRSHMFFEIRHAPRATVKHADIEDRTIRIYWRSGQPPISLPEKWVPVPTFS